MPATEANTQWIKTLIALARRVGARDVPDRAEAELVALLDEGRPK